LIFYWLLTGRFPIESDEEYKKEDLEIRLETKAGEEIELSFQGFETLHRCLALKKKRSITKFFKSPRITLEELLESKYVY